MTDVQTVPVNDSEYLSSLAAVREKATAAHFALGEDRVPLWTVYGPNTEDFPGKFIARLFQMRPESKPTDIVLQAHSLDELRMVKPSGLIAMARAETDDPNVVETWI